jgi:tryptophan synthase alpha subunit
VTENSLSMDVLLQPDLPLREDDEICEELRKLQCELKQQVLFISLLSDSIASVYLHDG